MNLRERARQLRKAMTPQEIRLWKQLTYLNRRGCHFRRQVPLDGYILDFADFGERLIIEVDGSQHSESTRDQRRDAHFGAAGFRVLRFWNIDVDTNMDGVIDAVVSALAESPHPRPSGGPSPRKRGREK